MEEQNEHIGLSTRITGRDVIEMQVRRAMIAGTVSQQLRLMLGLLMRATLVLMVTALYTHAQNSSANGIPAESKAGTSAASSYARDKIETVNLANGNFSLSIPLSTVGGRGRASFSIALSYNSKVWSAQHDREAVFTGNGAEGNPIEHHSAMYDKMVDYEPYLRHLGGGWTILNAPAIKGKVIGIDPLSSGCNNFTDGVRECGTKYVLTKLWLTLPDGSQVELRDSLTDGAPALTSHIRDGYHDLIDRDRGRVWHSIDGSGVSFVTDPNDSITPDSTFLCPPAGSFSPTGRACAWTQACARRLLTATATSSRSSREQAARQSTRMSLDARPCCSPQPAR